MKIENTIKFQDIDTWKEWVAGHIGVQGVDYFMVAEKTFTEFEDGGSHSGYNNFWVIPDPQKAFLWALRWS